jgi:hypothetical protein
MPPPFLPLLDQVFDLVALVGLGGALVVIAWISLHSSEQSALTWGAALGILAWLVGIGFALYLIFG